MSESPSAFAIPRKQASTSRFAAFAMTSNLAVMRMMKRAMSRVCPGRLRAVAGAMGFES
jgi:hypothetical protein